MKENTVLPSKYEALLGEDFTMITITLVVYWLVGGQVPREHRDLGSNYPYEYINKISFQ